MHWRLFTPAGLRGDADRVHRPLGLSAQQKQGAFSPPSRTLNLGQGAGPWMFSLERSVEHDLVVFP